MQMKGIVKHNNMFLSNSLQIEIGISLKEVNPDDFLKAIQYSGMVSYDQMIKVIYWCPYDIIHYSYVLIFPAGIGGIPKK